MKRAIIIASVAFSAMALPAMAQSAFGTEEKSSIVYHGGKKKYDEKIAQAAIAKAASKVGDLRGTITGGTAEDDIMQPVVKPVTFDKSSSLKGIYGVEGLMPHELPPVPLV